MSFNSRPHKEVDSPIHRYLLPRSYPFNSRPHKEVDVSRGAAAAGGSVFQFTTSQGGRHFGHVGVFDHPVLSIHDLTRRSTILTFLRYIDMILSIHDLTRRSTLDKEARFLFSNLSIHDLTRRSTATITVKTVDGNLSIHDLTRRSTFCYVLHS